MEQRVGDSLQEASGPVNQATVFQDAKNLLPPETPDPSYLGTGFPEIAEPQYGFRALYEKLMKARSLNLDTETEDTHRIEGNLAPPSTTAVKEGGTSYEGETSDEGDISDEEADESQNSDLSVTLQSKES